MQFVQELSQKEYAYVIGGAGLAGLTLAYKMKVAGLLDHKRLLIIDGDTKDTNDRTWSFWAKDYFKITDFPDAKCWPNGKVKTHSQLIEGSLHPYQYYSIDGLSYYQFIKSELLEAESIDWLVSSILSEDLGQQKIATKVGEVSYSEYYFKNYFSYTALMNPLQIKATNFLWQHFLGWKVKFNHSNFDASSITYMDMEVPQPAEGLAFVYILPESGQEALVEYTLFSPNLMEKEAYEQVLKAYLHQKFGQETYEIRQEEYGKIPMTTLFESAGTDYCIPIGTIAGAIKASTGYSFVRNQRHTSAIVKALKEHKKPPKFKVSKRHSLYDKVLIEVIGSGEVSGKTVFTCLYHKNKLPLLLKFLDEETSVWEEIKIMNSVPKWPFMKAVWRNLF